MSGHDCHTAPAPMNTHNAHCKPCRKIYAWHCASCGVTALCGNTMPGTSQPAPTAQPASPRGGNVAAVTWNCLSSGQRQPRSNVSRKCAKFCDVIRPAKEWEKGYPSRPPACYIICVVHSTAEEGAGLCNLHAQYVSMNLSKTSARSPM